MRYQVKPRNNEDHDRRTMESLQRLLTRHEAELVARKELLKADIAVEAREVRDAAESGADLFACGVGAALLEATERTVHSIEDALRRVKTGAYGQMPGLRGSDPGRAP